MSKYKLNFKLKQHTPIIHFQYDQSGATLRASELKPKLDKFLIEKLGLTKIITIDSKEKEVPKPEYKHWFINEGKEHLALDYKVRIESSKNVKYFLPLPLFYNQQKQSLIKEHIPFKFDFLMPCPYFGNTDKIKIKGNNDSGFWLDTQSSKLDEIRFATFVDEYVNVEITSFRKPITDNNKNVSLIDIIRNNIHNFFVYHNFGTRQNKGFGDLEVIEPKTSDRYESLLKEEFEVVYKLNNTLSNVNDLFSEINETYQLLKSGKNFRGYKKSLLFLYFVSQKNPIRWGKRKLKITIKSNPYNVEDESLLLNTKNSNSAIYDKKGNQSWTDSKQYDYKFIRALLGLTDSYSFSTNNKKYDYYVLTSNNKIERYKSPIQFKYNGSNLYIVSTNKHLILDEQFIFKLHLKKNKKELDNTSYKRDSWLSLNVPNSFDIADFFDFAFNKKSSEKIDNYSKIK